MRTKRTIAIAVALFIISVLLGNLQRMDIGLVNTDIGVNLCNSLARWALYCAAFLAGIAIVTGTDKDGMGRLRVSDKAAWIAGGFLTISLIVNAFYDFKVFSISADGGSVPVTIGTLLASYCLAAIQIASLGVIAIRLALSKR